MDDKNTSAGGSSMDKYLTPIALVVAGIIIGGALYFGHGGTPTTGGQPGQQAAAVKVNIKNVKTDNDPFVGDANAPVTIALWFDYQCPFCKQFDQTVTTQLYDTYIKTGKVKLVFKDFAFLGQDSITGGEFARAMWEVYPDHFYEWYQAMFAAQDEEGDKGFGNLASIQALTAKIPGVDVAKVTKLMTDKKATYDAAMAADRTEGQSMGVTGTPAVIVGTTLLSGAQPYATIQPLIDAQLKK